MAKPGRPPGAKNKIPSEIKELCQKVGPEIVQRLVNIAFKSNNETNVIAASKELLDRGYGRAAQSMTLAGDAESPLEVIRRVIVSPGNSNS